MNKLKAVFWDVDGTLADTELCGHRVAFNLAFKDFDLDWYWSDKKYIELLGISGGLKRIIHYKDEIHNEISIEKCSKIQLRKRFHYTNLVKSGQIKLRNGVIRLIEELSNCDTEQYIVTTSGRESLEPFLQTTMNSHLHNFSGIITHESVSKHKPFPDAYKLALKLSKKSVKNCIAIEDSNIGVEAAIAANINCLLTLPTWYCSKDKVTSKANACVDSLGDIDRPSKLIYGKKLSNKEIDFEYLNNIIN